jgi:gamma-tubulin complex component 4
MQQSLQSLLQTFYEQLTASMNQQPHIVGAEASRSIMHNVSVADALSGFQTTIMGNKGKQGADMEGDVRRRVERLLLRLDFNSGFSRSASVRYGGEGEADGVNILREGGLA